MKLKKLFAGLAPIIISLAVISSYLTSLAYSREGDINLFLGIVAPNVQPKGDETIYFKSDYQNRQEMYDALKEYNINAQIEGSVLLKNENNALPLKETDKVTLFGNASVNAVHHGGSGGPVAANRVSLLNAIKESGFSVNETVANAIKGANFKRDKFGNIGEVAVSTYTGTEASFNNYNNAAIIVLSRYGGEEGDLNHGLQGNWENGPQIRELALHDEEKDLLNLVKNASFEKRIVVINSGYAMELEELKNYNIDSVLWIGNPGSYGMYGVAKILFGQADPSGRMTDTFATNSLSSAAMQNAGHFKFTNLNGLYKDTYLIYAEGIYVGYKYYETRYNDCILNQYNADNNKGIYNSQNNRWNYADEVTYSFGDGFSYSSFTQELISIEWNKQTHEVTAEVKVTNNGSDNYSGKSRDVVQLYVQLPYAPTQAEKPAIQLVDFEKTSELVKNESEVIALKFSDYIFATYDEKATNGADASKKGCYTFDAGDYYFALGNGAHDALNNVLAKQGKVGLYDADGQLVTGDANKVHIEQLLALDNVTYATSPYTGAVVSNLFQDRDINSFYENDVVTYLTRSDWNTFPRAFTDIEATNEIKHLMENSLYQKPSDAPDISSFKYKVDNGIEFIEMRDVPFDDDERWESFIDQLAVSELTQIVGDKMAMDKINSISFPAYSGGDGPDGHQTSAVLYVNQIVAASTFSKESLLNRGKFFGEESLYLGFKHIYAPGANIHRTPYSGRNFEYYSEDATMSYICSKAQEQGMVEKGLAGMIKHFAGNDQETNRHGVATFMSEQAYRQGPLKGFEGALANGSLGTMTAYNRIGCIPTAADYQTMTLVLRNEWGFKGINMTDSSKDSASYMYTADCLYAGTNQFNNDAGRVSEATKFLTRDKDGFMWQKLRETAKYYLYAMSRSNLINGLAKGVKVIDFTPWWKPAAITIDIVLGVIGLGCAGAYVYLNWFTKGKKKEEN
ncbi:MAG TPA: hypothetical protein GX010_02875 [Erysipelotrichaceae bacterium]|nr:hypothetical protein [Erysipelotrichaceae bacterium]